MPKSLERCVTNLSSSTKLPSSSKAEIRSRAVSFPAACCFAMRASPPASAAWASICSSRAIGSGFTARIVAICPYSSRVANVKGSAMTSRILWVELGHGAAGFDRLLAAVSVPLREQISRGFVKANWYPFEQFVELNETIDRVFGRGDYGLMRMLGRYGADANLTTIYRLFFKVGSVGWILG